MVEDKDIENVIAISEEEVKLEMGGTRLTVTGVLSKRHAQILIVIILGMLGYNYEAIAGLI